MWTIASEQPRHDRRRLNHRQEAPARLLTPRCYPAVVLQPTKQALDFVAIRIQIPVIGARLSPIPARRDHRLGSGDRDLFNESVGVVALVG